MPSLKPLYGMSFGRLTVVDRAANDQRGKPQWFCRCECGQSLTVSGCNLKTGNSSSCGCLRREIASGNRKLRPYEALYRLMCRNTIHPVELTYEEFLELCLIPECHYCGAPVSRSEHFNARRHNKSAYCIDRKDNSHGYTKDNCVVCCTRCNIGKSQHFTYDEWKQIGDVIRSWKK